MVMDFNNSDFKKVMNENIKEVNNYWYCKIYNYHIRFNPWVMAPVLDVEVNKMGDKSHSMEVRINRPKNNYYQLAGFCKEDQKDYRSKTLKGILKKLLDYEINWVF